MKRLMLVIFLGGLVASSAFAYATRPMSVVRGTDSSGRITATCTFTEDTTGFVEKYNLYVVWADTDAGTRLKDWPNKQLVCAVTPDMNQVVFPFPENALMARVVRVILGEPTYASREDGLALIDYVEAKSKGAWIDTKYTPSGTSSFDMTFAITNRPGKSNHATLFCARDLTKSDNNATYTLFVQQQYEDGGYKWRLDYGMSAGAYTDDSLGFTHGLSPYRVQTAANGLTATVTVAKWNGEVKSATTETTTDLDTAGSTLHLFGCLNKDGSKGNFGRFLCWGFRATDNGELKLNLLPAKKTETVDGVSKTTFGLYDTVAKQFLSSGNTERPLSADAAVAAPLDECSQSFRFENDHGVERSMRIVPVIPEGKDYVTALDIALPQSDTKVPYRLSAVYPDGRTRLIGKADDNAANFRFVLPPHRNVEGRKSVRVRLEPDIPAGYELLPYVRKNGSSNGENGARIVTDYKMNGTSAVSARVRFVDVPNRTSAWTIFCSRSADTLKQDNPGQAGFLTWSKDPKKAYWRYDYNTANGDNTKQGGTNVIYTLLFSTPGGLQVVSPSPYIVDGLREVATFEAKGEMMLFASYKGVGTDKNGGRTFSEIGNNREMDIFWMTVKDSSGEKFTLVPVKCTAAGENEGKVGFWDFQNECFRASSSDQAFVDPNAGKPESEKEISSLIRLSASYTAPETFGLMMIFR